MSTSVASILPWFLSSLLLVCLQIASAVILLKERHVAPWLMLAGSGMALIGQTGSLMIQAFLMGSGRFRMEYVIATSAFATLGHLLFCIGLLLHALHQRAKADRIAQLEAILESRNV